MKKIMLILSIFGCFICNGQNIFPDTCDLDFREKNGLFFPADSIVEKRTWVVKYETGENFGEFAFSNWVKNGDFTIFYKTGKVMVKGEFKKGDLYGRLEGWYSNGDKMYDFLVGETLEEDFGKFWDKEGNPISAEEFDGLMFSTTEEYIQR